MRKRIFLFLFFISGFLILPTNLFSQRAVDSLTELLQKAKDDTTRISLLLTLSRECPEEDILKYTEPALELCRKLNYKDGIASALNNMGYVSNNYGQIEKAIGYFMEALKIQEEIGSKKDMAYSLNNIAFIYSDQGQTEKALEFYQRTVKIAEEIDDQRLLSFALDNIGFLYTNKKDYDKALEYHSASLKIKEKSGQQERIASSYSYFGVTLQRQGKWKEALDYFKKALSIWEGTSYEKGLASVFHNMGQVYLRSGEYKLAAEFGKKALAVSRKIRFAADIRDAEGLLYKVDSVTGNFKSAFAHYQEYIHYRDSVKNSETEKTTMKKQLEYDFDKKEAVAQAEHKKELQHQAAIAGEKNRKQVAITWAVSIGLLLVVLFLFYVYRLLKFTRAQKQIIELKSLETEKQKQIIEEKNKDILDSIQYARRIQQSLLPRDLYFEKHLSRLNKPKS